MNGLIVFQSDFGLSDGAVAAMYGVALSVDSSLKIYNLTHDIPPFDTFEASYRLFQAVPFWPKGTVFVTVVDPGVGSERKSIVIKTKRGQYIVTPDNGSISHVSRIIGIESAREISEEVGRRKNSENSYTFHGRDVYGYTGALLASGQIDYENIGPEIPVDELMIMKGMYPDVGEDYIEGSIETLDVRFGSLWTNIGRTAFEAMIFTPGDLVDVTITKGETMIYHSFVRYVNTFADVKIGEALIYANSMDYMALAINQGSFSKAYNIGTRDPWKIKFARISNIQD